MTWMGKIIGALTGGLGDKIIKVVDDLHLSGEEKQAFQVKIQKLIQESDAQLQSSLRKELEAKERILVAELQQGDSYTKRARPTVVYGGLVFIFLQYIVLPLIAQITGTNYTINAFPEEFWYGWSGIVATWSMGRTFEKRGAGNKLTDAITGNKSKLLD